MEKVPLKRKKVLFLKGFQLRYVLLIAGSLTVLLLFAGFHGVFMALSSLPGTALEEFKPHLLNSTWRLFLVGFLYIAVISIAAIFISHRSVGPTRRLEDEINAIADSKEEIHPLSIREGDELEGLVHSINNLIERAAKKK